MTENFVVLLPYGKLKKTQREIGVRSFADFYHGITPKHQKKVSLLLVRSENDDINEIRDLLNLGEVEKKTQIVHESAGGKNHNASDVLLFPSETGYKNVIPEALSHGIPVLSYDVEAVRDYIDVSCGMTTRSKTPEQDIGNFAQMLSILYFDPEVMKLLERGALSRFEKYFSWGLKQFRRSLY